MRCSRCGNGFFPPLDEELALWSGKYTPHLQECLALLGTMLPFDTAAQVLEKVQHVRISKSTAVQVTVAATIERTAAAAPPGTNTTELCLVPDRWLAVPGRQHLVGCA